MIAEALQWLAQATIACGAASLTMLALRRPLRRAFGARATYAAWIVVPLAVGATLLPAPAPGVPAGPLPVLPGVVVANAPAGGEAGGAWGAGLLGAWICGALLLALRDARRQRRFLRTLGPLQAAGDGTWRAGGRGGPVVLGAWRGRIVLPSDFEARFDAEERALILAHERVHVARRDLAATLLGAALRAVQWFNPVVHLAFARFRADQELAADAAVLQRRPEARRRYAEAMLKAQMSPSLSPLGCQWQSAHPLKERILMLQRPLPTVRRVMLGVLSAAVLAVGCSYAAWATQPRALSEVETQATYARIVPPKYPKEAVAAGQHGNVLLHVLVTADGAVEQVEVNTSSGHAALDAAAVATVRKWTFNPASNGHVTVPAWIGVPISFQLDEPAEAPPASAAAEPAAATLEEIYIRPR